MKTVGPLLAEAQLEASTRPYVRAVFHDFHADLARLRSGRWYAGSEGAGPAAACVPSDGSLVRARVNRSDNRLYYARVASPSSGSDYSTWTDLGSVSAASGVALAARGTTVLLVYVDADTTTVKYRLSTDSGATLGAPATLSPRPGVVVHLAVAYATSGEAVAFWNEGDTVYASRWDGSSWGTAAAWSNSLETVTGLACTFFLDWCVVVTGTVAAGEAKVWTALYGDGVNQAPDTWSGLVEVMSAEAGSGVAFKAPAVARLQGWRLFFVEAFSRAVGHERVHWSTMPALKEFTLSAWREPEPFDYEGSFGFAVAPTSSLACFLVSHDGIWRAAADTQAYDATEDVLEAVADIEETSGRVRLVLRNESGQYGPGTAQATKVGRGRRLQLSFGLWKGGAGQVANPASAYWVDSVEWVRPGADAEGRSVVVVEAVDAWHLLERWRARRQFAFATGSLTVFQILAFLFGRAGLDFTTQSASAAMGELRPSFALHPGESGKTAVLRLLEKVPDVVVMRGGMAIGRHPQGSDSAEYAYGGEGEHLVLGARWRLSGPRWNRVRAFGAEVFDERFEWGDIEDVGERGLLVHDLNLTTGSLAGARARDELRKATLRDEWLELVVPVQGGQEVYDQVAVTDAQLGLEGAKRRVLGLRYVYAPGRYELRLRLGSL